MNWNFFLTFAFHLQFGLLQRPEKKLKIDMRCTVFWKSSKMSQFFCCKMRLFVVIFKHYKIHTKERKFAHSIKSSFNRTSKISQRFRWYGKIIYIPIDRWPLEHEIDLGREREERISSESSELLFHCAKLPLYLQKSIHFLLDTNFQLNWKENIPSYQIEFSRQKLKIGKNCLFCNLCTK